MNSLNTLQTYMVHEYVDDYRSGHLSRRDLIRRVLNISGGIGSTATLLLALGCSTAPRAAATAAPAAPSTAPQPTAPAVIASPSIAVAKPVASPSPPAAAAASPAASAVASPAAATAGASPLSVPANDPTIAGQDITFPGTDGATIMAYEARPSSATGPLPLVMVCHENRGLTEHIRDVVRRYAKAGYTAVGVDLVSRQGGTAKITDPNQFSGLLTGQGVNQAQFVSDFASAVAYYRSKPNLVQADKIAMSGFCFGGGIVWLSTEQIPELKAAAPYYGAPPPLEQVDKIKAAVLGVYSADPNDFANKNREALDQALTAASITHRFNVYPGTRHQFNNDTGNAYNQEQAVAAWRDVLAWFKQYLA